MRPPAGFDEIPCHGAIAWVRAELRSCFEGRDLLPPSGPPPDGIHPQPLTGRGGAFALEWPGLEGSIVHRRLMHGGALRALTGTRFWGRQPRPFVELDLSETLRAAGVPTPRVAYAVVRRGTLGTYQGALATERIEGARALADVLVEAACAGEDAAGRALLVGAGRLVRALHDAQVFHADLNLRNLLVETSRRDGRADAARLQVIDLDGSRRSSRPLVAARRRANLDRMIRSLGKFPEAQARFGRGARAALLEGYGALP